MLPRFIAREAVGTDWFYDYDRGGWVHQAMPGAGFSPLPEGVTMLSLDNVEEVHNTIADAVGEPRATICDRRGR